MRFRQKRESFWLHPVCVRVCVCVRKSARVYNKLVNHAAHTHIHTDTDLESPRVFPFVLACHSTLHSLRRTSSRAAFTVPVTVGWDSLLSGCRIRSLIRERCIITGIPHLSHLATGNGETSLGRTNWQQEQHRNHRHHLLIIIGEVWNESNKVFQLFPFATDSYRIFHNFHIFQQTVSRGRSGEGTDRCHLELIYKSFDWTQRQLETESESATVGTSCLSACLPVHLSVCQWLSAMRFFDWCRVPRCSCS